MSDSDIWAKPVAGTANRPTARPATATAADRAKWTERVMKVARW
jgi:hypothetical protein